LEKPALTGIGGTFSEAASTPVERRATLESLQIVFVIIYGSSLQWRTGTIETVTAHVLDFLEKLYDNRT
jgi:hypothetical protein